MYTKAIDELKKQIQAEKESAPEPVDYSEQIVNLHAMIDCILDQSIDAEAKNEFLKRFIDRITYDAEDLGRKKGTNVILDVFLK